MKTFFVSLLVLSALAPLSTEAAITIVGTSKAAVENSGGNVTLTFDTGSGAPQQGDIVIVWGGGFNRSATGYPGPQTSGYTQIYHNTSALPCMDISYKIMGATSDTTVVGKGDGSSSDGMAYGAIVLRGFDPTNIQDQTLVAVGPTASTNPNCGAIVTQTASAWVSPLALSTSNNTAPGILTNYTNLTPGAGANDNNDASVAGATRTIASPGSEDPPAWSTWTTGTWRCITLAIRPASPPTVTTDSAQGTTPTRATVFGSISSIGSGNATTRGFAISTDAALVAGVSTSTETGSFSTGSFNFSTTTLTADTTYYYRAYADNGSTGYGNIASFTTGNAPPTA